MQLELTADDTRTLHALLRDTLPDLPREVARTDARDFRHEIVQRQELCERLVARLEQAIEQATGRGGDPVAEAGEESFPASDAPAWTPTTGSRLASRQTH